MPEENKAASSTTLSTPNIKFDNIKRLQGASNYLTWKKQTTIMLRFMKLWTVVSSPPDDSKMEDSEWQEKDLAAQAVLLSFVDSEWTDLVTDADNAHGAWKALEDKFDRKNTISVHNLLKTFMNLKYEPSESMFDFLSEYDQTWRRLKDRSANAKAEDEVAIKLKDFTSSEKVKAAFLLIAITDALPNVVDNLQTKTDLDYETLYQHLVDLHSTSASSSALLTHDKKGKGKQQKGKNDKKKDNGVGPNECSYCKKRGNTFTGHTHKDCRRLKADKAGSSSTTPAPSSGNAHVAVNPPAPLDSDSDCGIALVSSSSSSRNRTREVWHLDTCASHHITADMSLLLDPQPYVIGIKVGSGTVMKSSYRGTVRLVVGVDNKDISLSLSNVLYLPEWKESNLVSWSKIAALKKCYLYGEDNRLEVRMKSDNKVIIRASHLGSSSIYSFTASAVHGSAYISTVQFWHEAFGHTTPRVWSNPEMFKDGSVLPKRPESFHCDSCLLYNSTRSVPTSLPAESRSNITEPYDLIHTDLHFPSSTQSLGKATCVMPIVDDYTRYAEVFFLHKKSDASHYLKKFCEKVKNKTGRYPRRVRYDRGGEFINDEWDAYCVETGITQEPTDSYSHESNGVVERYNRTLATMCRPAMADMPKFLWAEAYNWACYVKNRLPHSALDGKSPYELLHNSKPSISHFRPFGSRCYVHIPIEKRGASSKLDPRNKEGRFVGYTGSSSMFRVYIPSERSVKESRQVTFHPSTETTTSVDIPQQINATPLPQPEPTSPQLPEPVQPTSTETPALRMTIDKVVVPTRVRTP
jgi:hypothetical protein